MKKNRAFGAALAALCALGLLAGCTKTSSGEAGTASSTATQAAPQAATATAGTDTAAPAAGTSSEGGKVTEISVGIPGEYGDLSPFGGNSQGRNYVKYALWESLAIYNKFGESYDEMDWILAKDIKPVDDVTTDIEIYDYIYDQAGNHITADDVVWSYEQAVACGLFPKVASNLKSITKTGDYSVRMVLNTDGLGDLEYMLAYVAIASQKAYEESPDKMANHPVSTGPYQVVESVPGSHLVLTKNEKYWQTDPSKLAYSATQPVDKITFQVIKETAQMSIALETGAIDIAASVAGSEIGRFMNSDGTAKEGRLINETYGGMAVMLDYNCDPVSPMSNKLVRQAVSYAIDREGLVAGALQGRGATIGTPASRACSDYDTAWDSEDYPYDPEKAKELLKQAGYGEGDLHLRIMTEQTAEQPLVAQMIQAYLADIGIEAEVLSYDNALFSQYRYQPDQFDMMIGIMGTSGYVVGAWDLQFNAVGSKNGAAACFAKDDQLQSLLEAAKGKNTHSKETVEAFAQYVREQNYGLGLYVKSNYSVANDKVTKIVCHPFGQLMAGACSYRQ